MSLRVKFVRSIIHGYPGTRYVVRKKARGVYTFDMLADDISHSCSLTRADVAGCMEALVEHTLGRLMDGYTVQYHNFGTFAITCDSQSVGEDYFTSHRIHPKSLIKGFKIRFIPCIKLRNKIKETTVELM